MADAVLTDGRAMRVGKILAVGRNYAAHARELGNAPPAEPMFFLKPSTAIVHDGGTVRSPIAGAELHYEIELAVLIGREARGVVAEEALEYVEGYGVALDMTLREVQRAAQKEGTPWTLAKGFDTSAPISTFVPASRVPDPQTLELSLSVNAQVRQRGSTADMIFSVATLIARASRYFTLEPGDLLFTGTPEGVGPVASGDELVAVIPGLARLGVRIA